MRILQNKPVICCFSALTLLGCRSDGDHVQAPSYEFEYEITYSKNVTAGVVFPIVLKKRDVNPRHNIVEFFLVRIDGRTETILEVKRGMGSAILSITERGDHLIELTNENGVVTIGLKIHVFAEDEISIRELSGVLAGNDLNWDSTAVIHITNDVYVPAGNVLNVGAGTIILVSGKVNIFVEGDVHCLGTYESPILFSASDQPWGMIHHTGLTNFYQHTLFTGGGGDESYIFGHSESQPVLSGKDCNIDLENICISDNIGKALGFFRSVVNLRRSLITRCDTGGELVATLANIEDCWFMDIPDNTLTKHFDSNDALYLHEPWIGGSDITRIYNSVFINGKNDGIDHNGANVLIESCVFSDFDDEGIATSASKNIEIFNSLIFNCEQGVESGYGGATVKVDHCLMINNEIGLRFGDEYEWGNNGSLIVTNSISVSNSKYNVWNFVDNLNGPKEGAIQISYSMMNEAEYDLKDGCLAGVPNLDSNWLISRDTPGFRDADDGSSMGLLPWGVKQ